MLAFRRLRTSILAATILCVTILSVTAAPLPAASQQTGFCSHTLELIAQAESSFAALRKAAFHGAETYGASLNLAANGACEVRADAEKDSYRCLWSYPRGDKDSRKAFQHVVSEMRLCIGGRSDETLDQSVNHPDFYASHVFSLSDAVVTVSLKDKSQPLRSFLSIRIDATAASK